MCVVQHKKLAQKTTEGGHKLNVLAKTYSKHMQKERPIRGSIWVIDKQIQVHDHEHAAQYFLRRLLEKSVVRETVSEGSTMHLRKLSDGWRKAMVVVVSATP